MVFLFFRRQNKAVSMFSVWRSIAVVCSIWFHQAEYSACDYYCTSSFKLWVVSIGTYSGQDERFDKLMNPSFAPPRMTETITTFNIPFEETNVDITDQTNLLNAFRN